MPIKLANTLRKIRKPCKKLFSRTLLCLISIFTLEKGFAMPVITVPYPQFFPMVPFHHLRAIDLRVGTVVEAQLAKTRIPALKLTLDFGEDLNETRFLRKKKERQSSAQIADRYTFDGDPREGSESRESIIGKQVVAAINFPAKQVGPIMSRFLVLGAVFEEESAGGTVALCPNSEVPNGSKVFYMPPDWQAIDLNAWIDEGGVKNFVDPSLLFSLDMRAEECHDTQAVYVKNIDDEKLNGGFLATKKADGTVTPIRCMSKVPDGTLIR